MEEERTRMNRKGFEGGKIETRIEEEEKTTNGEGEELDMYCNQIDHLEDTD